MKKRTKVAGVAAVAVAVAGATAGIAVAGGDDNETPITGAALEEAKEAALAHTGGGEVTETEVGDEDSYYEVEVTLPGGAHTDVQLDEQFHVVGSESDNENDDESTD